MNSKIFIKVQTLLKWGSIVVSSFDSSVLFYPFPLFGKSIGIFGFGKFLVSSFDFSLFFLSFSFSW